MTIRRLKISMFLSIIMCALLIITLSSATFAWFTNNNRVGTSRVTAKTAQEDVELLLSGSGGEDFRGAQEAGIVQVNGAKLTYLMPVSTADLQTFVYCPATVDDYASNFSKVTDEQYYYHGRIYMMARVSGAQAGTLVSLYLDESASAGGALASADENSLILNAARLGLVLDRDPDTAIIFRMSDGQNRASERANNTRLAGVILEEGMVLDGSGRTVSAAEDPAVRLSDFVFVDEQTARPARPVFTIEANRIYSLDIYFYLEGCDPDCTEAISFDANDLHLAFYGVLS